MNYTKHLRKKLCSERENISQLILLGQHNLNTKQTKIPLKNITGKEDSGLRSLMSINGKITKHSNKPKPNPAIY